MWLIPAKQLERFYGQGFVVPVLFKLKSDIEPQAVYQAFGEQKPSVLLESPAALQNNATHRYSYVAWNPLLSVRIEESSAELTYRNGKKRKQKGPALEIFRTVISSFKGRRWEDIDFFTGGTVFALSYELAHQFEKLPTASAKGDRVPDILCSVYDRVIVLDRKNGEVIICQNLWPGSGISFDEAYKNAVDEIHSVVEVVTRSRGVPPRINFAGQDAPPTHLSVIHSLKASTTERAFCQMVGQAKEYIRAGDIYQANLSQRFDFSFEGNAFGIYERLQRINPSPFAAFADWGDLTIVSSSPERLVRLRGNVCETRPIAGTRRRGKSKLEHEKLREDLLLSEKERAEHLMLVDLERNDLGRVSEYGSVRVDEWMTVECYSHVQHIVSNVVGRLKPNHDAFDLLRAMFPGGTITGCPKIRCMEIIHELEKERRGFYTGSLGYIGFDGDMDLNILIRTIVLTAGKGSFRVGAGIVSDSKEKAEYQETLDKAAALFEALSDSEDYVRKYVEDPLIVGARFTAPVERVS